MKNRIFFIVQGFLKYIPFQWAIGLRAFLYRPFFRSFGRDVIIHDNVLIKYPDEIDMGDNVHIGQGTVIVGRGGLVVGNDVMFGHGTKIVTSSHDFSRTYIPMRTQGLLFKPVNIGSDVWFGFNVVVIGGVTIGKGSILAAGAVVTESVGEYCIAGGVPAKTIKSRKPAGAV